MIKDFSGNPKAAPLGPWLKAEDGRRSCFDGPVPPLSPRTAGPSSDMRPSGSCEKRADSKDVLRRNDSGLQLDATGGSVHINSPRVAFSQYHNYTRDQHAGVKSPKSSSEVNPFVGSTGPKITTSPKHSLTQPMGGEALSSSTATPQVTSLPCPSVEPAPTFPFKAVDHTTPTKSSERVSKKKRRVETTPEELKESIGSDLVAGKRVSSLKRAVRAAGKKNSVVSVAESDARAAKDGTCLLQCLVIPEGVAKFDLTSQLSHEEGKIEEKHAEDNVIPGSAGGELARGARPAGRNESHLLERAGSGQPLRVPGSPGTRP